MVQARNSLTERRGVSEEALHGHSGEKEPGNRVTTVMQKLLGKRLSQAVGSSYVQKAMPAKSSM